MHLPESDDDGALPLQQVLDVLRSKGVRVMRVEEKTYLSNGETLEIQLFTDPVRRKLLQVLARKFGFSTVCFYYPGMDIDQHLPH